MARVTLPRERFNPAASAGLAARLALPIHRAFATAAPVSGLLLTQFGAWAVLAVALGLGLGASVVLISLRNLANGKGHATAARPPI